MGKLLRGIHIALLSLFTIYAGEEIVRWGVKLVNPAHESVKFWRPGTGFLVIVVSFVLLLAILACSTGIWKNPSWRLLAGLHGLWLVCFTWFGWFSVGGPFRLQELVGVDLSDPRAVSRAETVHLVEALAAYAVIVVISSIPLLLRWSGNRRRPGSGSNAPGDAPNPAFQHH